MDQQRFTVLVDTCLLFLFVACLSISVSISQRATLMSERKRSELVF